MDRILILAAADRWSSVAACFGGAHSTAVLNQRLSYGLVLREEPTGADLAEMHILGSMQYVVSDEAPLRCFSSLWQGENYVLSVAPSVCFMTSWDALLLQMIRRLSVNTSAHPVLTGIPPLTEAIVDAFRPVAVANALPDHSLIFRSGTPVTCAGEPQRTAFLNFSFCFAPAALFRSLEKVESDLSAEAFAHGWECFVPHVVMAHALDDLTPASVVVAHPDSEAWHRFAKRAGISETYPWLSGTARTGILNADLSWEMHVPLHVRARNRLHAWTRSGGSISLLCASAFLRTPLHPENTSDENSVYFHRLSVLKEIPMIFLADQYTLPTVQLNHPNVMEYLPSYGLPVNRKLTEEEATAQMALNPMFFLARCKERNPGHTHYAWVDPAAVYYPVDPDTYPDLKPFCTGRITLATVDGKPDLTTVIVPSQLLTPLCAEITAICEPATRKPVPFPTATELWNDLIDRFPSRFTLIPYAEPCGLMASILGVSRKDTVIQE